MYVDAVTKKPFFELALRGSAADNARGNGVIREGGRFPFAYADATILDSFGKLAAFEFDESIDPEPAHVTYLEP